jgi:acyl-CoA synthetase (NDP forming)
LIKNNSLKHFFAPRSIALVGATDDLAKFGGRVLKRVIEFGYAGEILPINPKYAEIAGRPAYASIAALPTVPDHVGIAVPAQGVLAVLEECAAHGVPFATVFTGGFAESGTDSGRAMQDKVRALARASGMRVMGPNCNGLINFVDHFSMTTSATIAGPRAAAGNVGIVSQSGGAGQVNVMWRAIEQGIGISYEVSFGNSADLDALDFARFMVEDEATRVILMLAEHLGDGEKLREVAALAAEKEKPIVVLKLGRTDEGSQAAATHTGSLTGNDAVHDAAFRQYGIIRVDDCNELYEAAMLLRTRRWPRGNRAAATTISGGNGVLLVDLGAAHGIAWPSYSAATQEKLGAWLPKLGTTSNPTDVTNAAIGKKDIFRGCIEAIASDEGIDAVIPIMTMSAKSDVLQIAAAAKAAVKPVAVLWTGGCNDEPALTARTLAADGVAVYRNTLSCVKAVRAAMRYGEFRRERQGRKLPQPPADMDVAKAKALLAGASGPQTERRSKEVLAALGFPVTRETLARTRDEAAALAAKIGGPVALKIESADIAHKTESGAIRLGVTGEAAVRTAFDEVMAAAKAYRPDAKLDGVLVQEMVGRGVEVMVGLTYDPVFGPVLVVGAGGVYVEVFRDIAYRIPPIGVDEAHDMLRELKSYKLLEGARGAARADIPALCELVSRLSHAAVALGGRIRELDLNPVIVLERGVRVVDALIVPGGAEGA